MIVHGFSGIYQGIYGLFLNQRTSPELVSVNGDTGYPKKWLVKGKSRLEMDDLKWQISQHSVDDTAMMLWMKWTS